MVVTLSTIEKQAKRMPDTTVETTFEFKHFLFCFQGTSTKFSPQRVGLSHIMHDEDVIQVIKK